MFIIKRKTRSWDAQTIDGQVVHLVGQGLISPVAWWLMASYAYYRMNISFLQDETFDWLGRYIKEHWDAIKHPHKALIKKDGTFTGFYINRYPTAVIGATVQLLDELHKGDTKWQKKKSKSRFSKRTTKVK